MMSRYKLILRPLFLIGTGGMIYYNFEIIVRGYSHISMFLCGGLSFYSIGLLNEGNRENLSFLLQMFLGSLIITFYELITGLLVNLHLHLNVWDYSRIPFNYKGQVCLPFTILWFFLTPVCILFDDAIRFTLFGRKKPVYVFRKRKTQTGKSRKQL